MARVLVTGGTGFIGGHLVESLLARGDDVTCIVRDISKADHLKALGVRLACGDVSTPSTLPAAVTSAEVVYHLAGLTKARRAEDFERVNHLGTQNLVQACAQRTSPPVLLLLSSLAAAGPSTENRPRAENDPPQPASNYGLSKRAGEIAAEHYAHAMPVTVVRPPIVVGPGDRLGVGMYQAIRRTRTITVIGRGRRLSAVHAADLVQGMTAAADRGERLPAAARAESTGREEASLGQGYYFIAADECPWFAEMARTIGRSVGRQRLLTIRVPTSILWLVGAGGELIGRIFRRPMYLNLDRVREITAGHWTCTAEKARRQLGFRPAASLEQRLEQTGRWYREHGWV